MKNFATTQLSNNARNTLEIKSGLRAKQFGPMLRDVIPQLESIDIDKLAPIGKLVKEELYRGSKASWQDALVLTLCGRANGRNSVGAAAAAKAGIGDRKEMMPEGKALSAYKARLAVDILQREGLVKLNGSYNFGYTNRSVSPAVSAPATARKRAVRKTA